MHARSACCRPATTLISMMIATLSFSLNHSRAADAVGAPVGDGDPISISPQKSTLIGRRATAQLIASSRSALGGVQDQTRAVEWVSLNPEIAQITPKGQVAPKANGVATIVARLGSHESRADFKVERMDQPSPVSFRRDVIPAVSQASCNMGACHGTPTGKGGFRLSLRGYLPDQDFGILSREAGGRRINPIAPETSLILRKPLGEVPHEGGLRLRATLRPMNSSMTGSRRGPKTTPPHPRPFLSKSFQSRACFTPRPVLSRSSSGFTEPTRPSAM